MEYAKLVKKDCGLHYGEKPGPCRKCQHETTQRREHPERYQYDGTPWAALLGGVVREGGQA